MNRTLIESMKRLYENGDLTKEELLKRVENSKITEEEYKYIVNET